MLQVKYFIPLLVVAAASLSCKSLSTQSAPKNPAVSIYEGNYSRETDEYRERLFKEGQDIFRYDTFGSEDFWGGKLKLHEAINGTEFGGTGPGLTPKNALEVGLKVDAGRVPKILVEAIRGGHVSLDKVKTTLELLKADAVVGVKGFFDDPKDKFRLTSIGITCAICHSTVNDSLKKGIGTRLDGWPNRDLNVGAVAAMSPDLSPFEKLLAVNKEAVKKTLESWGPGKYDAELNHDGKGFRPDGKTGATVLPAAFGLAGINLHTYNGWGSVPYWNAYVAVTQMHGKGTFFDRRMSDSTQYPVAARSRGWNARSSPDLVTPKLAALHYYQLSLPAPKPGKDTFDKEAAKRGEAIFNGKADCARCHVPPLFTEPGWSMHTAKEIGIDEFQASRSPDKSYYRTTPLRGLFTRMKGGFYHDGRFSTLDDVVGHYVKVLKLELTDVEKKDLIEYLKSI